MLSTMYDINSSPRSGYHLPRPPSSSSRSHSHSNQQQQQQQQQQPQQQQQQQHRFSPSESAHTMRHSAQSHSHSSNNYLPSTPPTNMMTMMQQSSGSFIESRVYGRTKDLRKLADARTPAAASSSTPTSETASIAAPTIAPQDNIPGIGGSTFNLSMISSKNRSEPCFSVEVFANAFDERGYPIYAGKAASLAANVRLNPSVNADIQVTTYAYTTAGSSAAVWDGVVLLPSTSQNDRHVFKVKDRFETNSGQLSIRSPVVGPPGPSSSSSSSTPAAAAGTTMPAQEDYILTVPIRWNLPIGASRAVIDGQAQTVHVPLPPSFEVTRSEDREQQNVADAHAAAGLASSSASSVAAPSIYRGSPPGSSAGTTIGAATLTTLTPKKSKARTVRGMVERSLESVTRLGCFYMMEFALVARDTPGTTPTKAEKSSKKTDKNAAKERILDVISIPFIFGGEATTSQLPAQALPPTLRPQLLYSPDAILAQDWQRQVVSTKWTGMMLKALRRGIQLELHLPAAPAFHAPSVIPFLIIIRPSDASLLPPAPATSLDEKDWASQVGSQTGSGGGRGGDGFLRRPATAPTIISNASSPTFSSITRTTSAAGSGGTVDLTRVVMVSLVQVVYSTTPNVNDLPVRKRQIMSVAQEVEEVDLGAFLADDASTSDEKVVSDAQAAGVRVLAGKLRVSPHVTPSFRSQGIEVKYAVKIDLVPFAGSSSSSRGEGGGGSSGLSSSGRSEKEGISSSASSTVGSLSSAMRSLRLKGSNSRFGSSYAGSIFSGKSRRARGFSDGTAVDQDWNATASMPAGSPGLSSSTSGGTMKVSGQGMEGGAAVSPSLNDHTRTQFSPPSTPPWNNGVGNGRNGSPMSAQQHQQQQMYAAASRGGGGGIMNNSSNHAPGASCSSSSPSTIPRSISEGTVFSSSSSHPNGVEGGGVGVDPNAAAHQNGSNGQQQQQTWNGGAAGYGVGLASPLMGPGGTTQQNGPSSYAPSSWAPSNASQSQYGGGGGGRWASSGASQGPAPSTSSPTTSAALLEWDSEYRSRLSRLSKTAGALWADIRVVRGADAPIAPLPSAGVVPGGGVHGSISSSAGMMWVPPGSSGGGGGGGSSPSMGTIMNGMMTPQMGGGNGGGGGGGSRSTGSPSIRYA
ncbi:hypothetical protein A4X13_0g6967 [Tilletia indica]|uniref:Uncharacterized protein n=1 Tax=Tilletia indica TaxID=43049 RepID=A0A8T8SMC1_9BASI|nr:hypothetical protein A4X13_0g6967 [Tilletia indica]